MQDHENQNHQNASFEETPLATCHESQFKIHLLTFKALHGQAPIYIVTVPLQAKLSQLPLQNRLVTEPFLYALQSFGTLYRSAFATLRLLSQDTHFKYIISIIISFHALVFI